MSETTEREHQGAEVARAEVARAEVARAEVAPAETRVAASRRVAAYLLLLAVLGCVAAMSWSGLYGWALTALHWSPGHAALVPISLDVAAMVCALLALDSLAKGEAATMLRALTAAFVALSAFINWRHAIATGNVAEQIFFPSMSILAYALVHAVFGKYRREVKRDLTGRPHREVLAELPRLGAAAWVRYPARTFGVGSAAIAARLERAEAVVRPAEVAAAAPVRSQAPAAGRPPARRAAAPRPRPAAAPAAAEGDLAEMPLAAAIRAGLAEGLEPREVPAWLAERGRPDVPPSRVYDVVRRDREGARGRLTAV